MEAQRRPNILVTGTPGTGKTSFSTLLADAIGFDHVCVGEMVKEKRFYDGWDEELECHILDEDLLLDELEEVVKEGGKIVDYHSCELFPERWFEAVVVLQTDNSVLYDRLSSRGYSGKKLQNNIECEIFQVLLEEAKQSYSPDIVRALPSNTIQDLSNNVEIVKQWLLARNAS